MEERCNQAARSRNQVLREQLSPSNGNPPPETQSAKVGEDVNYIVIEDAIGHLYIQRRTLSKDYCPGMLDVCCGAVVQHDEAYGPSALRELDEEMGIRNVPLTTWGTFYHEEERCRVWGGLYSCQYDGELALQAEEVEYVLRMPVAEVLARQQEFTPDSIQAIKVWLARRQGA